MAHHQRNDALHYGARSRRRSDSNSAGVRESISANRSRISMSRFVLALCLVAALIMAAYKPARGTPTGDEKCTATAFTL